MKILFFTKGDRSVASSRQRVWQLAEKLFEYMTAGKPIVTYSNKCTKEVLSKEDIVLIQEDLPGIWTEAVNKIITDKDLADLISKKAKEDALKSREEKGRIIFDFVKSNV